MSTTPTPRTDVEMAYPVMGGVWSVDREFARQLETELAAAIHERKFDPAICECPKGHHFRTTPNTPAKSEREWECPHCAVIDRDRLKAELAAVTAERDEARDILVRTQIELLQSKEREEKLIWDRQQLWKEIAAAKHNDNGYATIAEERDTAQAQLAQMQAVLEEAQEYFKDRMDADHDGSRFVGNVEMKHYQAIAEALATFKSKHPSA